MSAWSERMKVFLGKRVAVTLSDTPGEKVIASGKLLSFDEGGEVVLLGDDGFIHWCWPNLHVEEIADTIAFLPRA